MLLQIGTCHNTSLPLQLPPPLIIREHLTSVPFTSLSASQMVLRLTPTPSILLLIESEGLPAAHVHPAPPDSDRAERPQVASVPVTDLRLNHRCSLIPPKSSVSSLCAAPVTAVCVCWYAEQQSHLDKRAEETNANKNQLILLNVYYEIWCSYNIIYIVFFRLFQVINDSFSNNGCIVFFFYWSTGNVSHP